MRAQLMYVQDYGWHAGRLLLWPVLLFYALFGVFPWLMLEAIASLFVPDSWPVAMLGPVLLALWTWRRVRRKLRGEPFIWEHVLIESYGKVDSVHRHLEPGRWRMLMGLEV